MCYLPVTTPAAAPLPPLRCLLVDDEPRAAAALAACVQAEPSLLLAGTCTSPEQARVFLQQQAVDVLFLSIDLPLLPGLALLRPNGACPAVVLTSTYPDYNLQDYEAYGVIDFLLKPIHLARFRQVVARLNAQCELAPALRPAHGFFTQPQTDGLYFWVNQQLVQVRLADVLYVEDLGNCTRVETLHQAYTTEAPFATLAGQLPEPRFLRVNPTFAVALRQAAPVASNALAVGGRRIAVGSALQDEVLARAFQTSLWGA